VHKLRALAQLFACALCAPQKRVPKRIGAFDSYLGFRTPLAFSTPGYVIAPLCGAANVRLTILMLLTAAAGEDILNAGVFEV
jgi:hypothetical protein